MSTLTQLFTSIANAIREKTGSEETILAEDFSNEILNIPTGGGKIVLPDRISFQGATFKQLPEWLENADWSELTSFSNLFDVCGNLKTIDIDIAIGFSTTKSTGYMFRMCSNLISIKLGNLDLINRTSDLGTFSGMFQSCPKLDDETLNMIMKLLMKLRPNDPMTLKAFGLTSTQATKCQQLSNYQAFLDAGWTTGY